MCRSVHHRCRYRTAGLAFAHGIDVGHERQELQGGGATQISHVAYARMSLVNLVGVLPLGQVLALLRGVTRRGAITADQFTDSLRMPCSDTCGSGDRRRWNLRVRIVLCEDREHNASV